MIGKDRYQRRHGSSLFDLVGFGQFVHEEFPTSLRVFFHRSLRPERTVDNATNKENGQCSNKQTSQKLVCEDRIVATNHSASVLSNFVKQIRSKARIKKFLKSNDNALPPSDIVFLLQDWDDGYNVGGLFRVADACGATELVMTGKTPTPENNPQVGVTSMGAHRKVPWRHFARHDEACQFLLDHGYTLVAVEVADESVPYHQFQYPSRCALVLGNEGAGVYGSVMKKCEHAVFIPMRGKGRSLNVHVAASIVAFRAILSQPTLTEPE